MQLSTYDWSIIFLYFLVTLILGTIITNKSGKNSEEFFLGSRKMPWWLLGISMVATTFSADTPNLVTDIVRNHGVSGNWAWWAFLLTGMLTVFIYAKLWRRSEATTDLEFYELRYSGKEASFLRGFRAVYLGVFFNVVIMATVILAGIKIAGILIGISAIKTVIIISLITVVYSAIGGYKGVLYTDFFQFILAMIGMVWASIYIVNMPEIGGLTQLLSHPEIQTKMDFIPPLDNMDVVIPLLLIPLAVQWWSVWYPGAEPGGGGYIAQRMLSAKDEKNAVIATLLFNVAHYALRPWPWILIAFASIVVFPELSDIAAKFPSIEPSFVKDDLAFPAMLYFLPSGLMGLVIAALIAALMSTISTHLNWGSSYIVNDVYQRFMNKSASEKQLVFVARISTVILMVLGAILSLYLTSAKSSFDILLQIGAGTGLLFILRWFWWRINAVSEIVAMVISFVIALVMELIIKDKLASHEKMVIGVAITSIFWIGATYLSKPTDMQTLIRFYTKIRPHSIGWAPVIQEGKRLGMIKDNDITQGALPSEILMMFLGCIAVYALLFGMGYIIYNQPQQAIVSIIIAIITSWMLYKTWMKKEKKYLK